MRTATIGILVGLACAGCKSSSKGPDAAADVAPPSDGPGPADAAVELPPPDAALDAAGESKADTAGLPDQPTREASPEAIGDAPPADRTPASETSPADRATADSTTDLGPDSPGDGRAGEVLGDGSASERPGADGGTDGTGCTGWTTLVRLSPADAKALIDSSDPIVINVHVPYEGDIPGTDVDIPYTDVDAIEAYLNHDHCADVLLVCKSGGMSQSAGSELIKRGYLRIRDLNGGMMAWEQAGYPLLKDGGV